MLYREVKKQAMHFRYWVLAVCVCLREKGDRKKVKLMKVLHLKNGRIVEG